jgi:formylglycine-generating enzyme required for sulfatase activity
MNESKKELISKNTSLTPLSTGLASRGLQIARQLAQRSYQEFTNSIGMKLVLIHKGTFMMGSPESEEGCEEWETQHQVTISRDYYLGVTAVTQAQFEKVMGTNPSFFQGNKIRGSSSNHPVDTVWWEESVEFCNELSELPEEKKAGREYRLPTEAEWEYACRAGSKTAYSFGDNVELLSDYAWFDRNSGNQTHPVAKKKPNAWGLYDMHGNVWEWCSDWYDDYPKFAVTDPIGPSTGAEYVIRGGGCYNHAMNCRSANRCAALSEPDSYYCGFRVALSSCGNPKSREADK